MFDDKSLEERVVSRAWQDAEFRQALSSDPRGAIWREFGIEVPESVDLRIVEEARNVQYIVIPAAPAGSAPRSLEKEELEAIAGGACSGCTTGSLGKRISYTSGGCDGGPVSHLTDPNRLFKL